LKLEGNFRQQLRGDSFITNPGPEGRNELSPARQWVSVAIEPESRRDGTNHRFRTAPKESKITR